MAKADSVPITGNTADDAVITDSSGNVVSGNLDKYVAYTLTYHWTIPNGSNIKAGDTATFTLPDNVQVTDNVSFNITYNGEVVGTFYIAAGSKTGTLTFNNYFEEHPKQNISGNLEIQVTGTTESEKNNYDWMINKVGWFDQNGVPTWNIALNPNGEHYDKLEVKDVISDNQELIPGTVIVQYGHYDENGKFIVEKEDDNPTYTQDGQTLDFTFTDVDSAIQIVYQPKPTSDHGILSNKATVQGPGIKEESSSAQLSYGGSGHASGDDILSSESSTTDIVYPEGSKSSSRSEESSESTTTKESSSDSSSSSESSSESSSSTSSSTEVISSTTSTTDEVIPSSSTTLPSSSVSSVSATSTTTSDVTPTTSTSTSTTEGTSTSTPTTSTPVSSSSSSSVSSSSSSSTTTDTSKMNEIVVPPRKPNKPSHSTTTPTNDYEPGNSSKDGYPEDRGGQGYITKITELNGKIIIINHNSTTIETTDSSAKNTSYLPQTGDQKEWLLVGIGALTVVLVGSIVYYRKKRR